MTLNDTLLGQIDFTRSLTLRRIEHFPKEAHFIRLPDGGNHFIWLVGHLVWSEDALILTCCSSKSHVPAEMSGFFAYGAKLLEDEDGYPELDQLLDLMGEVHEKVLDYVSARYGDYVLLEPPVDTHTYILWLAPIAFLLTGAAAVAVYLVGQRRRRTSITLEPDQRRAAQQILNGDRA